MNSCPARYGAHGSHLVTKRGRSKSPAAQTVPPNKRERSSLLKCIPCHNVPCNDAEYLHPILHIPICGTCYKSYKDANFEVDASTGNAWECIMCGVGDGNNMYMCDSCPKSFCDHCIVALCGKGEIARIKNREKKGNGWFCYHCDTVKHPAYAKAMLPPDFEFFNIEGVFNSIRPPAPHGAQPTLQRDGSLRVSQAAKLSSLLDAPIAEQLLQSMSPGERKLASLFSSRAATKGGAFLPLMRIADSYLTAQDLPPLRLVSKKLYSFFQKVIVTPGLFKTDYGLTHECMLHPHQVVSLRWMREAEHRQTNFGALRGGILADAPGLGKTVTVMALVLASAGDMPKSPESLWEAQEVEATWASLGWEQKYAQASKAIIKAVKETNVPFFPDALCSANVRRCFVPPADGDAYWAHAVSECASLAGFEKHIRSVIRGLSAHGDYRSPFPTDGVSGSSASYCDGVFSQQHVQILLHSFKIQILQLKTTINKKVRHHLASSEGARLRYEKELYASSATLIVVPMALLEHWHEQLSRHINLDFLQSRINIQKARRDAGREITNDFDRATVLARRGLVYFDGLGDLIDVQAPLPKLKITNSMQDRKSALDLSQYLIVVTTFERCTELQLRQEAQYTQAPKFGSGGSRASSSGSHGSGTRQCIQLNQVRWLRLVVDEGHELGGGAYTSSSSSSSSPAGGEVNPATSFIRGLAAERRWVMTGTPTTGTSSSDALRQIQRLLCFLRHPQLGVGSTAYSDWRKLVADPFLMQSQQARSILQQLLSKLMVRHVKSDLELFEPIRHTVLLEPMQMLSPASLEQAGLADNWRFKEVEATAQLSGTSQDDNVIDKCKAVYIFDELRRAKAAWKRINLSATTISQQRSIIRGDTSVQMLPERRPKVIIFSQESGHLNGVGHFLYLWMGEESICEHGGHLDTTTSLQARKFLAESRSSELSRFRSSMKKTRQCPICGTHNGIASGASCSKTLLLVEYETGMNEAQYHNWDPRTIPVDTQSPQQDHQQQQEGQNSSSLSSLFNPFATSYTTAATTTISSSGGSGNGSNSSGEIVAVPPLPAVKPAPGGHGHFGRGGHYTGRCLCSPTGCTPTFDERNQLHRNMWRHLLCRPELAPAGACAMYPNPFLFLPDKGRYLDGAVEAAKGRNHGYDLALVSEEHVREFRPGMRWQENQLVQVLAAEPSTMTGHPQLWRQGRMGGFARIRAWKRCGKGSSGNGWHAGQHLLGRQSWKVTDEDASVLLLHEDGSTGLDLSFATHIFLLNNIRDPALESQIISRAHRMGATGPVKVTLLLANEVEVGVKQSEQEKEIEISKERSLKVIEVD